MEIESNEIFHHNTRTSSCERLLGDAGESDSDSQNNSLRCKRTTNDPTLLVSKHNHPLLFHRSRSITIPISNQQLSTRTNKTVYSQSYNCTRHCDIQNYGAITDEKKIYDDEQILKNNHKQKLSTSDTSNSSQDVEDNDNSIICCGFNKRQLKVFISLILLSLNEIMGYSAIAPFFPIVAESKGLSATSYGLIFAAYSLCGIFASLIAGTVLVKVGAKFCVLAGMFWNTGALFCFGFLDKTASTPFFILAIVTRGLMGFGSNGAFTAMFAIIFQEFNDRAITVLSLSESLVGIGGMVAPLIGGGLYDLGGYVTPFMVLGSVQVILLVMCWYMLPYVPIQDRIASRSPFYLLTHSSGLIASLFVIYIFVVNSFFISNVSTFLSAEFPQITATSIGVILLVSSLLYAGMSPIWGYVVDKWKGSFLMEVGTIGVAIAMTFAGPALFLRNLFGWERQQMWLVYVTSAFAGMFFGGALMPTFDEMLTAATELQLSDTILAQYGLVSGLWNMAFAIGDVLGPTLGGALIERFQFQNTAAFFAAVGVGLTILKLLHRLYRKKTRHNRSSNCEEEEPLLTNSDDSPQMV